MEDEETAMEEGREKASLKEKSWELLRCCRDYIKTNSTSWKADERIRKEEREQEQMKKERLKKVGRKKRELERR